MELQLLVDERGHIMQTVVNEARDERLVAPKKLGISLLDERDPEFFFCPDT